MKTSQAATTATLFLLAACGEGPPKGAGDSAATPPSTSTSPTTAPTTRPTTSVPTGPCALKLEVDAADPFHVIGSITLEEESSVAVACVASDEEALLWESPAAREHTLHLAGLLPDTDYTCTAVAPVVCPTERSSVLVETPSGGAPATTVERHPTIEPAAPPYTLINTGNPCDGDPPTELWIFDPDGGARWKHQLPAELNLAVEARYHGGGTLIWGGGYTHEIALQTLHLDHTISETLGAEIAPDASMFHHDGKRLDDGTKLALAEVENTDGVSTWYGFRAIGIDGPSDWTFDSQVLVDAGVLPPAGDGEDAYHANWIDVVDGVLYVSLCFIDEILAIDLATETLLWRLAPGSGLALLDADGSALPDSELSQCQHGLEVRGDRLLVYDNGRWEGRHQSRAFELTIDEVAGTATRRWLYAEPDWFDNAMGDIDYLADDRVLITMAHVECWGTFPDRTTLVELDTTTQEVVWRMSFDDLYVGSYRSERIDACDAFPHRRFCDGVSERMDELGL
jgi:hypothetical protein